MVQPFAPPKTNKTGTVRSSYTDRKAINLEAKGLHFVQGRVGVTQWRNAKGIRKRDRQRQDDHPAEHHRPARRDTARGDRRDSPDSQSSAPERPTGSACCSNISQVSGGRAQGGPARGVVPKGVADAPPSRDGPPARVRARGDPRTPCGPSRPSKEYLRRSVLVCAGSHSSVPEGEIVAPWPNGAGKSNTSKP